MPIQTKRAIAEPFKKLLSKRGLKKITVRDIVEDCGVNRQTFYYHFHDVYDLMEWIFQDTADTLLSEPRDYRDWSEGLRAVTDFLRQNRVLVHNAYHSVSHKAVANYIKRTLRPYMLRVVQTEAEHMQPPAAPEDIDFVTDLLTLSRVGIFNEWIEDEKSQIPDDRMEKLLKVVHGSIPFMLKNLQESGRD